MGETNTNNNLGVLFNTDRLDHNGFIDYALQIEALGFESLWLPELFTRDPFASAGFLLARTSHLKLATGIANIYGRDPVATVTASAALQELSQGRFMLGLGVSNRSLNKARGHSWQAPVTKLRSYLEAMAEVKMTSPKPRFETHVAAHGPKMLACAAEHADGANTYLMPTEHASRAAAALGSEKELNTMLFCQLETNPEAARQTARKALAYYTGLDYYHRAWRDLGFNDDDFTDGGSDKLIDAIVAWGDIDQINERINNQFDAGATRVVVIPIGANQGGAPDWELLATLCKS
ncbi:MAG: TIGR03620 family F420-dependent LLM class oxidoreductase [Pseudomonadota bacterium]